MQQAAGDFLFHCHIAEHYPSGMWGIWRVFDTLQPDLAPLPDRVASEPPRSRSAELIGRTMPNGTVLTKDNLATWINAQLPPPGHRHRRAGCHRLGLDGRQHRSRGPVVPRRARAGVRRRRTSPRGPRPLRLQTGRPVPRQQTGDPVRSGQRQTGLADDETASRTKTTVCSELHSGAPWLGETADRPPIPTRRHPSLARPMACAPPTRP